MPPTIPPWRNVRILAQMGLLLAGYLTFGLSHVEPAASAAPFGGFGGANNPVYGFMMPVGGTSWYLSNLFLLLSVPFAWSMRLLRWKWWWMIVVLLAGLSLANVLRVYSFEDFHPLAGMRHWVTAHVLITIALIIPVWKPPRNPALDTVRVNGVKTRRVLPLAQMVESERFKEAAERLGRVSRDITE